MVDDITDEVEVSEDTAEISSAPEVVLGDAETEVTNEGDTVIDAPDVNVTVVSADTDSDSGGENVDVLLEHERRITALEIGMQALAVNAVEDDVEDEIQDEEIDDLGDDVEEIEDDVESAQTAEPSSAQAHPLFRSWGSWRGR